MVLDGTFDLGMWTGTGVNGLFISRLRRLVFLKGTFSTFLNMTQPSLRFTSCTSQPASNQALACALDDVLLHHVVSLYAAMGRLLPIKPSMRANESFTLLVNAALNFRWRPSPSYFETGRGATIRLAQCRHSIAVGSPVATSGTMQSRQNSFWQRWHFRIYVVLRTLPQIPHSSFKDDSSLE